jgi:hypothetical protein
MLFKNAVAALAGAMLLAGPAGAQQPPDAPPIAIPPPGVAAPGNPLPAVGRILDHRRDLGLSRAQVESLERLGLDVTREAIRRRAELRIAELDLAVLLDRGPDEPVDMKAAEAKTHDVERLRTEIRVAVFRAVEAAKDQLTPDQRARLGALVAPADRMESSQSNPSDPPPGVTLTAGQARGGRPPAPGGGRHPRPPDHHDHGSRVAVSGSFWWGAPYSYWGWGWGYPPTPYWGYPYYAAPPVVVQPPAVYIEQAPPGYWYYCPSAGAYYPTIQTCPEPWITVAPRSGS